MTKLKETLGETWPGAQTRQMHGLLPNSIKNSQDPRGNDALREVDSEWSHDFANRDHGSNMDKPRTHERQSAKSADPGRQDQKDV